MVTCNNSEILTPYSFVECWTLKLKALRLLKTFVLKKANKKVK